MNWMTTAKKRAGSGNKMSKKQQTMQNCRLNAWSKLPTNSSSTIIPTSSSTNCPMFLNTKNKAIERDDSREMIENSREKDSRRTSESFISNDGN
jgi:hypothetical protein